MTQARRWKLSATQRAEMWSRWTAGQSLHAIGRALGKDHVVIQFLLARSGGMAPPVRRRSLRTLTLAEREDISRGIACGWSIRRIAQGLNRTVSTVSREAPEQISGWLKREYAEDQSLHVSHGTIYRSLFIQARGALKQELVRHLRSQRRIRRSRHASMHGHSQGRIVDALSIRERPAEVEDRAIPGHWEGDLLRGTRHSHVATLVERHSRFCMLVKVPGKDTATVVAALSQHVQQLPATLRRSLTWDRGLEMAQHKSFTMATDVQVYFCDPQSPWQRGSNENTNGLLRQYLPKKADLSCYSQSDLDEIALRLNQRPRKTLGFQTPADRLQASVASTP
jgi:IS30 family transposase